MDLIWREHKRFILGVAGALIVGLIAWSYFISPVRRDAELKRADLKRVQDDLAKKLATEGQPTEETHGRAREDLKRIEDDVATLAKDLALDIPPEYGVPAGDEPGVFFQNKLNQLRQEFKRRAPKVGSAGVRLPSEEAYGIPPGKISDKAAPECLARLAILRRAVSLAFDAGVREIQALNALPGVGSEHAEDAAPPAGVFLQRHRVEAKLKTSLRGLMHILHGLGQKGNFLTIERLSAVKEEPHTPDLVVELAVSSLTMNWDGTLKGSTPAQAAPERAGGYRRRR